MYDLTGQVQLIRIDNVTNQTEDVLYHTDLNTDLYLCTVSVQSEGLHEYSGADDSIAVIRAVKMTNPEGVEVVVCVCMNEVILRSEFPTNKKRVRRRETNEECDAKTSTNKAVDTQPACRGCMDRSVLDAVALQEKQIPQESGRGPARVHRPRPLQPKYSMER